MDIEEYLPPKELLSKYSVIGPYEARLRNELYRKKRPGCDFVLISASSRGGKGLWIVPAWHPLALVPEASPGMHYGQGWFEGSSVRPVVEGGNITAANIVLEKARNERFLRSAKAIGLGDLPVSMKDWQQGIRDLVSLFDQSAFLYEGNPVRVYLRPAGYREGDFGVTPRSKPNVNLSCFGWTWPFYLPEEVYREGAVAAAFVDQQRLEVVRGKVFGNYTFSGEIGRKARELGAHEAVLFGPYVVDEKGEKTYVSHWEGESAHERLAKEGVLADGPGEDVLFFAGDRLIIQPKDTGILAGTTREYITKFLAPSLGMEIEERPISLRDVRGGEVTGMAMCGNAANIAPIRELHIYSPELRSLEKFKFGIDKNVLKFVNRFEDELMGKVDPSNEGLLTRIELDGDARSQILEVFRGWY